MVLSFVGTKVLNHLAEILVIVFGKTNYCEYAVMNIASLLVQAAKVYDWHCAVALGKNGFLNYRELAQRSAILANSLLSRFNLEAGDRVAIIAANCPEYVELYFAAWHAGLVVVPVNAKLHQKEYDYILRHSGAKVCFSSQKLFGVLSPLVAQLVSPERCIVIGSDDYSQLCDGRPMAMAQRNGDDPAWLFYTSGTTGRPKGAMQSHKNLFTMTQCYLSDVDSIAVGDCLFHAAPMSHGGGYYMLPHVAKGGVNVVPSSGGFDEKELLQLLGAHRNVSMFAAPTMVKRWMAYADKTCADPKQAFANLKTIVYGGGPMYQNDLAHAQQMLGNKLVQIYGQGECPMTITVLNKSLHQQSDHPEHKARLASVGVAMTGMEVIIADDDGFEVECGQVGEILVRGDALMLGYFNDPVATNKTIVNGWLRTGDMATKNSDGFITLVDRCKDVIISGGSNIYPREVEEVLNNHQGVLESSVIGKKHEQWGEVVVAIVVPKPDSQLDFAQLDSFCIENIARFKRPKDYIFVDALPKNNTGKILKTALRERYA